MKRVEILKHGDQWIDTTAPIVCPECASLEVKKYKNSNTDWSGPFSIRHEKDECLCEVCNCRFVIGKERKSISGVVWDEFWGAIALVTLVIFIILLIITACVYHDRDWPPTPMAIALFSDLGICAISFFGWLICN